MRDLPGRHSCGVWGVAAGTRDPSAKAPGKMGAEGADAKDSLGCGSYPAGGGRRRRVRPSELAHSLPYLPSAADAGTAAPAGFTGGRSAHRPFLVERPAPGPAIRRSFDADHAEAVGFRI